MYQRIMVPVDLAHVEQLTKALTTGADLAKLYQIPVCYVGVTAALPGSVAHNPDEYDELLRNFTQDQKDSQGLADVSSMTILSNDPAVDLDDKLMQAAQDLGADLIVMASHKPGLIEHIFASNAGYVASYSTVSVLVVR